MFASCLPGPLAQLPLRGWTRRVDTPSVTNRGPQCFRAGVVRPSRGSRQANHGANLVNEGLKLSVTKCVCMFQPSFVPLTSINASFSIIIPRMRLVCSRARSASADLFIIRSSYIYINWHHFRLSPFRLDVLTPSPATNNNAPNTAVSPNIPSAFFL